MALLSQEHVTSGRIEEGDAGVILKKDGSFQLFNTHESISSDSMTERQIEQGRTLLAFSVALQVPAVMEALNQFVTEITDTGKVVEFRRQ